MTTSNAEIRSDATIRIVSPWRYSSRTLPDASCDPASPSGTGQPQPLGRAVEDVVDVAQKAVEVEHPVELGLVEGRRGLRVDLEQAAQRKALVPRLQRVSLHDLVGVLAGH